VKKGFPKGYINEAAGDMEKHYTVLVIDHKGSRVRETRISKRLIWTIVLASFIAVTMAAAGTFRYMRLQHTITENKRMSDQIADHKTDIEKQRKQIQAFAQSINQLKSGLIALNDFENKIRVIAHLEQKGDHASLFSIGGSIPEDLEPELPLSEDHDGLVRQMHQHIQQINQASEVQSKSFEKLFASLEDKRNVLASTPSLRPAKGWVSSEFGYRISPFTGRREFHNGLDIANREGTPIIAPADGVITVAEERWLIGKTLTIDHGFGMVTRYGHMHKLLKKKGDRVKRGETIALMGNTGRSTGPHLHYEVRLNGVPVNPRHYILD
jgi:murein DD-endopeptidase MepM/ murein hydrolase activator NlpD